LWKKNFKLLKIIAWEVHRKEKVWVFKSSALFWYTMDPLQKPRVAGRGGGEVPWITSFKANPHFPPYNQKHTMMSGRVLCAPLVAINMLKSRQKMGGCDSLFLPTKTQEQHKAPALTLINFFVRGCTPPLPFVMKSRKAEWGPQNNKEIKY
jgi:hypothetical protein